MPANRHPANATAVVRALRVAHAVAVTTADAISMYPEDAAAFDRIEGIARMIECRRPAWATYDPAWLNELSCRVDDKQVAEKVSGKAQTVLQSVLCVVGVIYNAMQTPEDFEQRSLLDAFAFAGIAVKDADEAGFPVAVRVGRMLNIGWPEWKAAKANKRLGGIIIDALKN